MLRSILTLSIILAISNVWATPFNCSTLSNTDAADVCQIATTHSIATVPLADGVKDLDRTLEVTVSTPTPMNVNGSVVCTGIICESYTLPAVSEFKFFATAQESNTALSRGNFPAATTPVVKFDCDTAADQYTLIMWDSLGFGGGPASRTSKGFMHGAWVNIGCDAQKKSDFANVKDILRPYGPPGNPSAIFANNYGFYLFKQSAAVPLVNGKLTGFNNTAFDNKANTLVTGGGLDFETDVLATLRSYLESGGPKARAWAFIKGSPFSALYLSFVAPNNGFGQCGGTVGIGGPVAAVKAQWAQYKSMNCPSNETGSTPGSEPGSTPGSEPGSTPGVGSNHTDVGSDLSGAIVVALSSKLIAVVAVFMSSWVALN